MFAYSDVVNFFVYVIVCVCVCVCVCGVGGGAWGGERGAFWRQIWGFYVDNLQCYDVECIFIGFQKQ